mmetsp:Transcript_4345/g.6059  ORF Transcript_4345/g.6059 Transcript_4345/m.6059 type:complete len:214 (-) Transcript_4345:475-1116(-)
MYYCDCLCLHLQLCYWLLCFICTCICIYVSLCISIFSAAPHLIIAMSGRFTQQLLVVWLDLFGGDTEHAVQKASDDHQSSSGYLRVDWTCQQEQNTSILSQVIGWIFGNLLDDNKMFPNDSPPSSLLPSSSTRPKRCLSTSEMVVFIESRRDRVRSFYVILLNLLSASFVFCTTNIQRLVSSSHHSDHGNSFITDIFSSYLIVITQPGYRMSK